MVRVTERLTRDNYLRINFNSQMLYFLYVSVELKFPAKEFIYCILKLKRKAGTEILWNWDFQVYIHVRSRKLVSFSKMYTRIVFSANFSFFLSNCYSIQFFLPPKNINERFSSSNIRRRNPKFRRFAVRAFVSLTKSIFANAIAERSV